MSVQLGHISGISIRLHFTLVITFVLIDWSLSSYFMPGYAKGLSATDYWAMGSIATAFLFISILIHELAHSIIALRYKIPVKSITLFIFGGVSDILKEPHDFKQEFKMSIAGPLTSFALGGVFLSSLFLIPHAETNGVSMNSYLSAIRGILYYGAIANMMLGTFNLIPAFPLDGGRVLRAGLVRWKKNYYQATKIATTIGVIISYIFMGFGFMLVFKSQFVEGLWIILIGWFLNSGAQSYMTQFELTTALKGISVDKIMNRSIITINQNDNLDEVFKNSFAISMKSELPVTDEQNHLLGMVALKDIATVSEDQRRATTVKTAMIPKEHLAILQAGTEADKALFNMIKKRVGKVFICDKDGKIVGVISKTDIIEVASERQKYLHSIKRR